MIQPLILDLDRSLHGLAGLALIDLADWQEAIRFGCSRTTWKRFRQCLAERLPATHGTVCMGSGDFHHISHLLLERIDPGQPFDVIVLDNHPDNMRFPFGIHCGSWVKHAAQLPQVRCIHVLGITSSDVTWQHAWENHFRPLIQGKVHYWTSQVDTTWAKRIGLAKGFSPFQSPEALVNQFIAEIPKNIPGPVYLSIDKDVFSTSVAQTNWDQGNFMLNDAHRLIQGLAGKLIGSDITGEVSIHHYQTSWKRWLSAVDQQPVISPDQLALWQAQQLAVNRQLLAWLGEAGLSPVHRQ